MPIQFRCIQCDQPIEVDDAYARQAVTCPYCRRVVTAPEQSTLVQSAIPAARPSNAEPGAAAAYAQYGTVPPPPPFSVAATNPAARAAKSWGNAALVCVSFAVAIFIALFIWGFAIAMQYYKEHGEPPTSLAAEKYMNEHANPAVPVAGSCGTLIFAAAGLVLAIISLSNSAGGNWRGWTALSISSLMLLGFGCLVAASMSGAAPPA
ncbi:MAG: hypothetical protein JNG88_05620 [Phycisphaerales bacterium]|nr:hypothetical protein [Phycisphaerales bacterium]